jgi:hypothetical protein
MPVTETLIFHPAHQKMHASSITRSFTSNALHFCGSGNRRPLTSDTHTHLVQASGNSGKLHTTPELCASTSTTQAVFQILQTQMKPFIEGYLTIIHAN